MNPPPDPASSPDAARWTATAETLLDALDGVVLGQRRAAEALLVAYMAGGHALLEGVPGIGKTLLARAFAACLGAEFRRVQFTPDLMPADVIGSNVFDRSSGGFHLVQGPVFTRILMADEINRTPPKTQSALLEAMEERQVTIDGTSHLLAPEFFVVATQNPLEFEGVYSLPEAQLDRFLLKIDMGLPDRDSELALYRRAVAGELAGWDRERMPGPVIEPGAAAGLRWASRGVHAEEEILDYLARLAAGVRESPQVDLGVSPRGALALLEAARAAAVVAGRGFITPDDLKRYVPPCWGHRVLLSAESELEGHSAERVLEDVAAAVEVPR